MCTQTTGEQLASMNFTFSDSHLDDQRTLAGWSLLQTRSKESFLGVIIVIKIGYFYWEDKQLDILRYLGFSFGKKLTLCNSHGQHPNTLVAEELLNNIRKSQSTSSTYSKLQCAFFNSQSLAVPQCNMYYSFFCLDPGR